MPPKPRKRRPKRPGGFQLASDEDTLSDFVKRHSKAARWRRIHFRPGQNRRGDWATQLEGDVGFPDWTLVRGGRLIFAELKGANGRLGPGQQEWLDDLGTVPGVETYVWYPSDIEEIKRVLR